MKRMLALTVAVLLLLTGTTAAQGEAAETRDFRTLAGLDKMEQKLEAGVTIDSVYYTDGYGFSTSEFRTSDPDEIRDLWQALNGITLEGPTDESITDWYPQIVFYFSDGTIDHVSFEAHWLTLPASRPQVNYKLANDESFWNLTAAMTERYGSSVHPKETWLVQPPEGPYCAGVRSVSDDRIDLALYTEDRYERSRIEQLQPGDIVMVNGKACTAAALLIHGSVDSDGDGEADRSCTVIRDKEKNQALLDRYEMVADYDYEDLPAGFELTSYELITEEEFDGYIAFEVLGDNECRAVVNDWNPCTYVGAATVQIPLPEGFVFTDSADNEGGEKEFLEDVSEDRYTPYNTTAWFANGQLTKISHSDYPVGPEK